MRLPHHLERHPLFHRFYFRLTVPRDLRQHYGRSVFKFSLKTRDPAEAKLLAYALSDKFLREFATLRGRVMGQSEKERLEAAHAWLDKVQAKHVTQTSPLSSLVLPDGSPLKIDPASISKFKLTYAGGVWAVTETNSTAEDYQMGLQEAARLNSLGAELPDPDNAEQQAQIANRSFTGLSLSQAIASYLSSRSTQQGLDPNDEAELEISLRQFNLWHQAQYKKATGEIEAPLSIIIPQTLASFRQWLETTQKERYIDKVKGKKAHSKAYSLSTLAKRRSALYHLFEWAITYSHYHKPNPASGLAFKITKQQRRHYKSKKKREGYSEAELKKIFDPKHFKPMKPSELFPPLMGICLGARISELTALEVNDFETIDKVPALHIRGTKTAAADRWVPLHKKLIEAGLLDYVQDVQKFYKQDETASKLNHRRIYPYLTPNRRGMFGKVPSDAFQRHLIKLGIKPLDSEKPKKDFHSTRYIWNSAVIDEGIDAKRRDFVGHAGGDLNRKVYGKSHSVKTLARDVLPHVKLDWLNVKPFKYQKGSALELLPKLLREQQQDLAARARARVKRSK